MAAPPGAAISRLRFTTDGSSLYSVGCNTTLACLVAIGEG